MTPQERDILTSFLNDLLSTPVGMKDTEAAAMIDQAIRSKPDSVYLLVQHAILADQALRQAQSELMALRSNPIPSGTSFLGAATTVPPTVSPAVCGFPPPMGSVGSGFGSGLGSFLRNVGTMAAGVAVGDMMFSGLSNLFGGHQTFGGGSPSERVENVTVNNYDNSYDDANSNDDWSHDSF